MQNVKVKNMRSVGSNKEVTNQFIIETDEGLYFQSYDSVIAFRAFPFSQENVYLDVKMWDYSVTTGKYRNIFLHEDINETRRKIADGTYKLADLNA